jgi:hypothetical protein
MAQEELFDGRLRRGEWVCPWGAAADWTSTVAAVRRQFFCHGEFAHWETWRYGVNPVRG